MLYVHICSQHNVETGFISSKYPYLTFLYGSYDQGSHDTKRKLNIWAAQTPGLSPCPALLFCDQKSNPWDTEREWGWKWGLFRHQPRERPSVRQVAWNHIISSSWDNWDIRAARSYLPLYAFNQPVTLLTLSLMAKVKYDLVFCCSKRL